MFKDIVRAFREDAEDPHEKKAAGIGQLATDAGSRAFAHSELTAAQVDSLPKGKLRKMHAAANELHSAASLLHDRAANHYVNSRHPQSSKIMARHEREAQFHHGYAAAHKAAEENPKTQVSPEHAQKWMGDAGREKRVALWKK